MNATGLTQIGKYHVISELGRGGMGVVYRAEDRFIGREVAIKTLTSVTPELMSRFRNEAKFGKLNHPNIVTIYDFGDQDGMPYIVMQFLQGSSLEKLMASGRPMPLDRRLDIIRQVCAGLGYAHGLGVVHRDIKSANIMVEPDGTAKIVDFGIARLESVSSQSLTSNTVTGAVIGTLHYISPERLKGYPADGRSDIWSVGVMLYQMVTGRLPFDGEVGKLLQSVVNEPHTPPRELSADCSEALEQIIDRALAKNPDDRYSTAEEMEADIEGINEGLKRQRAGEFLARAGQLIEEEKLAEARTLLLELQRLDPQNLDVKKLMREVAYQQARQQKSEQLRQLTTQAEEAVLSQRYGEAVDLYTQASRIDKSDALLVAKLDNAIRLRDTASKVRDYLRSAQQLREQSDFQAASEQIDRALELDPKSTDLRNEKVAILREAERTAREGQLRTLVQNADDALKSGRVTQAIELSREALNLDRASSRAQRIYQDATLKQEEDRRRQALEQLIFAIEESIYGHDLDRAAELVRRGLEKLPNEAALLRLKADVEGLQQSIRNAQIVDAAASQAQGLIFDDPRQALDIVQRALEQLPGEQALTALKARIVEQLNKRDVEVLRSQYIQQAQAALQQGDFAEAEHVIETAVVACGEDPSLSYMLTQAKAGAEADRRRKLVAGAAADAEKLMAAGDFAGAVRMLEPAAESTADAGLAALLERAREQGAEVARRVQSAMARAETLGAQDPGQALQFLSGQPTGVQADPAIRAFKAELRGRAERATAVANAVRGANESLEKKDYTSGLDALESIRSAYGDLPELAAAVRDYEGRRSALVNAEVTAAIEAAREALSRQQAPAALERLRAAGNAVQFADAPLQTEWKRLGQEAVKAGTKKAATTGTIELPDVAPEKSRVPLFAGVGAVVLLATGAGVFFMMRPGKQAATPTPPTTGITLQLDAVPWATVSSVQGPNGIVPLLPDENITPVKFPGQQAGNYQVMFLDPDGGQHAETCTVSAASPVCKAKMEGYPPATATPEELYANTQLAAGAGHYEVALFMCRNSLARFKQVHPSQAPPADWINFCNDADQSLRSVKSQDVGQLDSARALIKQGQSQQALDKLVSVYLNSSMSEKAELKRQALQSSNGQKQK